MLICKSRLHLHHLLLLLANFVSGVVAAAIQPKPAKMTTLCVIYVSEGVKQNIIKQLTQKASLGGPLVHSFVDATYGRTSFYLMGKFILRTS